mgnify:CR=1 FL=1
MINVATFQYHNSLCFQIERKGGGKWVNLCLSLSQVARIIQYEPEIAVLNYSPYLSAITQSYTTFYSGDGVSFEKI